MVPSGCDARYFDFAGVDFLLNSTKPEQSHRSEICEIPEA